MFPVGGSLTKQVNDAVPAAFRTESMLYRVGLRVVQVELSRVGVELESYSDSTPSDGHGFGLDLTSRLKFVKI